MILITLGIAIGFFIVTNMFLIDPGLVTENSMLVLGFSFLWIAIIMGLIKKLNK